uniref:Transcription initiation factor IIB n=1 Tax=Iridovirus LCIVAC01 TaxID=2506607 RepID=A0A481YQ99_9VIRU|nr:MAG: transcription initiation factor IIB [Iridovirus LCIVAC01]
MIFIVKIFLLDKTLTPKMSEFKLFDEVLHDYNNLRLSDKDISQEIEKSCPHENVIDENGGKLCTECGIELQKNVSLEKEWRYYGANDTKHTSDPNRCHMRKIEERSIVKDVETYGFGPKVVARADIYYKEVTGGKIYRGNSRKSIVFACIFHAYKTLNKPQTCENLIKIFGLERKAGLNGLKHVNLHAPKDSPIRTTYITAENLIEDVMKKFNANKEQVSDVTTLYSRIKNRSTILNRSRPLSVAAGLVYYYTLLTKKDIPIKKFTEKVKLSELTVNKIAKEISKILKTPSIL